jgi:hypothetical protein
MNQIFKYSFLIYRAILILMLPLLFIGKFITAMCGHNTPLKVSDYLVFYLIVFTSLLLILLPKIDKVKIALRTTIRNILILLITINILYLLYGLYDMWQLYHHRNFTTADNIPLAIMYFLIVLSFLLLIGLIKNKF